MSRIYKRPPLIEALCEFQFVGDQWDWTMPGLIYQKICDQFPQKRQTQFVEFELQAEPEQLSQRVKGGAGRMQFLRSDESALVQVGPNLLVINHLQPYPHWKEFKRLVFDVLTVYNEVASPTGFKRIGVRYINRVEIPDTIATLTTFFNIGPQLPESVTEPLSSVVMRVELDFMDADGRLLLTLATAPDAVANTSAFILDFDFVTTAAAELTDRTARDWVDTAHSHIETVFEACLTDRLRNLFEEVRV